MEKSKVDMFMAINSINFQPHDLIRIKEKLEKLDDEKFYLVQSIQFQKPDTIFLIAIFFGLERFFLEDIAMGVLKFVTCYGCFIWWIADIFSAKERTYRYNAEKLNKVLSFI